MIHLVDDRLAEEVDRFSLVFTCERCASFDEPSRRCSLGYPNEMHRQRPLAVGAELVFCKEFDLA